MCFFSSSYRILRGQNTTFNLFNICDNDELCPDVIRICGDSETSTDYFVEISSIAAVLFTLSLAATFCLFRLGNFEVMYRWSLKTILHPMLLQEDMKKGSYGLESNVKLLFAKNRVTGKTGVETFKVHFPKRAWFEKLIEEKRSKRRASKVWNVQPLNWALQTKHFNLFGAMMAIGANWFAHDEKGTTALDLLIMTLETSGPEIFQSRNGLFKSFILTDQRFLEIFEVAASYEATNCIDLLIANKRNLDMTNKKGNSALHFASINNLDGIISNLSAKMADPAIRNHSGLSPQDLSGQLKTKSPLHLAVEERKISLLNFFLDQGADTNIKDRLGRTPLHSAAMVGNLDSMRLLIEKGSDVNAVDGDQQTPLHLASIGGYQDCIKLLMKNKADVSARNEQNMTAASLAKENNHIWVDPVAGEDDTGAQAALLAAAEARNVAEIQSLLGNEPQTDEKLLSAALHSAAEKGDVDGVACLLDSGASVDARNKNHTTPAHTAALHGQLDCLKLLIEWKADLNVKNSTGQTPSHLAALNNQPECLRLLAESQADIELKDDRGLTPLHAAVADDNYGCALVLIENGASVNVKSRREQNSPVHVAASKGSYECLKLLLQHGANVSARNWLKSTPLHLAAQHGFPDCVGLLIENSADINAEDSNRRTPLHLASEIRDLASMQALVSRGAGVNAKDKDGFTPLLMVAKMVLSDERRSLQSNQMEEAKKTSLECLKLLLEHGAEVNAENSNGLSLVHILAMSGLRVCRFSAVHSSELRSFCRGFRKFSKK